MTTLTETSYLPNSRQHAMTPISREMADYGTSTHANMVAMGKNPHFNSVVSLAYDMHQTIPSAEDNFQRFSNTLLKNKALLVPRRLALKRQRASLKPATTYFDPISTNTLQLELGNPDETTVNSEHEHDENTTVTSHNMYHTREAIPVHATSAHTTPVRDDTPHTVPADISLMYREKPLFAHPITGNFIVQYTETNGGPSPCSYVLPRKSCREKNAPAFSFGAKCAVEKKGGSRTAWQKQWFAHSNPYTTKVDFNREPVWPTPFHYTEKTTLGVHATKISFPAWSIASRLHTNATFTPENGPGPDTYNTALAFNKLKAKNTSITLKSRPGGTQISATQVATQTPGPAAHDPSKFLANKASAPKHSFGRRIPTSLGQDPYVSILPSIEI